jgi:hypothetical protein
MSTAVTVMFNRPILHGKFSGCRESASTYKGLEAKGTVVLATGYESHCKGVQI